MPRRPPKRLPLPPSGPAPLVIPDFERASVYLAGWKDGAANVQMNAMKHERETRAIYARGYQHGLDALKQAMKLSTDQYTFPRADEA